MALVFADLVQENTSTTGTGTLTLTGATSPQFQTFAAIGNANTTYYRIISGNDSEIGSCTYTAAGTTLSRDAVFASIISGVTGTTKIAVAAGATVICTNPAKVAVFANNNTSQVAGQTLISGGVGVSPAWGSSGVTSFAGNSTGLTPTSATTGAITLAGTLNVANGGTGTTTPALVAGTNITVSGTWPNQTINASGSAPTVATTTTNAIFYPIFNSTTSGSLTTANVSASGFGFNPSTNVLTLSADASINNVSVGSGGGSINTNIAIGNTALLNNAAGTGIGTLNTAIGYGALTNTRNGASSNNVAVGYLAGATDGTGPSPVTDQAYSVFIGSMARPLLTGGSNETVIGYANFGNGSNTVSIGNGNVTGNYFYGSLNIKGNIGIVSSISLPTINVSYTYTLPSASGSIATLGSLAQTFTGTITVPTALYILNNGFTSSITASAAAAYAYTLPGVGGLLATVGNTTQTFNGPTTFASTVVTFGNSVLASTIGVGTGAASTAVTKTVNIGTGSLAVATTNVTIGSALGLGSLNLYPSTATTTLSIGEGSTLSGATKRLYIGGSGLSGSTTQIIIGGTVAGSCLIAIGDCFSVFNGLVGNASTTTPTIASATTIAPVNQTVFISGTVPVVNITAATGFMSYQITLIPKGAFTTTTAGNIALASTAVVNKALIMTYDSTTLKWYPSY